MFSINSQLLQVRSQYLHFCFLCSPVCLTWLAFLLWQFDHVGELVLHLALCTGVTECGDATVVTETSVDAIHHSGLSPHGRQRVWSEAHYTHALSHPTRRLQNQREKIAGCRESSTEFPIIINFTWSELSMVGALYHLRYNTNKNMPRKPWKMLEEIGSWVSKRWVWSRQW